MLFGNTFKNSLRISVLFLAMGTVGCKRLKTGSCIVLSSEADGLDQCIVNYDDKSCRGFKGKFTEEEALPAFMRCKSEGFWTPRTPGRNYGEEAKAGKIVTMTRRKKTAQ